MEKLFDFFAKKFKKRRGGENKDYPVGINAFYSLSPEGKKKIKINNMDEIWPIISEKRKQGWVNPLLYFDYKGVTLKIGYEAKRSKIFAQAFIDNEPVLTLENYSLFENFMKDVEKIIKEKEGQKSGQQLGAEEDNKAEGDNE